MPVLRYLSIFVCAILLSGCHRGGYLAKRESELKYPTDIRQMVPWCAGEDAILKYPCGPNQEFYGYKPTCWGVWPTSGAEWRDAYCPPQQDCVYCGPSNGEVSEPIPLPELKLSTEEGLQDLPAVGESEEPSDIEVGEAIPIPALEPDTEETLEDLPAVEEPIELNSYEFELINPAARGVQRFPKHNRLSAPPINPFR